MSDSLLRIGQMLTALPRPMTEAEVRGLARRTVYAAINSTSLEYVAGVVLEKLKPHGGELEQAADIARVVLDLDALTLPVHQVASIVGSVWVGVAMAERRAAAAGA